ncbi:hypothetical protein FRC02_001883 [Tulasnella sp. 418]|nr:hypothetical protein FRC02_001883 [Tulasnella sp. 418]
MADSVSLCGSKPVIAICGARGNQGSAVIQALLAKNTKFDLRGITRHAPNSTAAKELAALGLNSVVQADYDNPSTLLRAFEGCYGVFGVTSWYEAGKNETQQGKNLVDAAKACGVKHFVWSSAPLVGDVLSSFTSKALVTEYLETSAMPYTCIQIPIFYDSVFMMIDKLVSGALSLRHMNAASSRVAYADLSDIGIWVANVFDNPDTWSCKTINPCTEWLSTSELAEVLSETSGKECQVIHIPLEDFLSAPENELLRGVKADIDFIAKSYDNQVWSTRLGHELSQQPKTWIDKCKEKFHLDETTLKTPVEEPIAVQMDLCVQVTRDYDERAL